MLSQERIVYEPLIVCGKGLVSFARYERCQSFSFVTTMGRDELWNASLEGILYDTARSASRSDTA